MIANFMRGFVDGSLSTLGIVVGAVAADTSIVIAAGLGGALANGISNVLSAISAEELGQHKELREVEKAMVSKDFRGSKREQRVSRAALARGTVDGVATVVGGVIPVFPYFFCTSTSQAMLCAIVLVIGAVSFVGMYLGKVSKRNIAISALKMGVFGAIVAVVVYLVQLVIVS